jgi:Carbohydrate binding domain
MMTGIALSCAGVLLIASAALAQERAKETIISDQASASWGFDGAAKVKEIAAEGIPGGRALQADVAAKGANPWDIQARLKLKEGFAAGDTVTFGFYARAIKPDPGKDSARVNVRVQRAAAPYDAAIEGPIDIGPKWQFHCLAGPAKVAIEQAQLEVSVQLAGEKHDIAFGPYLATRIPAVAQSAKSGLPCGQVVG